MSDTSVLSGTPRDDCAESESPAFGAALDGFGAELERAGYGEFLASFPKVAAGRNVFRAVSECLTGHLYAVSRLFLLGEAVRPETLPPAIQRYLAGLMDVGVLITQADGSVQCDDVVVRRVGGFWYVCHPPQANPLYYLGEDSLALLGRLMAQPIRSCVDLCAGPGLHALHCATFAESVTAVELDSQVAELARLNVHLNGRADRVKIVVGDLCAPLGDCRFDLVVANPPSLPYPSGLPAPRVGHGGIDGRHHVSKVLRAIPHNLTDNGSAHLVGMTTTDGTTAEMCDWLAAEALCGSLDIVCTVLSQVRLHDEDPYFRQLTCSVSTISGCDEVVVLRSYEALFAQCQVNHLASFSLRVTPGSGHLECIDLSRTQGAGMWHV